MWQLHWNISKATSLMKMRESPSLKLKFECFFCPSVEKYRTKQVKDVSHQEELVRELTNTLENGNLPQLIFYGPLGNGRATTSLAITIFSGLNTNQES